MSHGSFADRKPLHLDLTADFKAMNLENMHFALDGARLAVNEFDLRLEGEVTLGGRNVRDYSIDSLMENFSFVFQRVYLFEDTVANNIRFGRPEASMDEVIEAAKKASCHEYADMA